MLINFLLAHTGGETMVAPLAAPGVVASQICLTHLFDTHVKVRL